MMNKTSTKTRNQTIGFRGSATIDTLTIRASANVSIRFAADAPLAAIANTDVASAAIPNATNA